MTEIRKEVNRKEKNEEELRTCPFYNQYQTFPIGG